MPKFIVNIESKSRGNLKYGLDHPDGIFRTGEFEPYLNTHIGFDYQIASIYPVSEEEYAELQKSGFSELK